MTFDVPVEIDIEQVAFWINPAIYAVDMFKGTDIISARDERKFSISSGDFPDFFAQDHKSWQVVSIVRVLPPTSFYLACVRDVYARRRWREREVPNLCSDFCG
jgi:hypothetical protein